MQEKNTLRKNEEVKENNEKDNEMQRERIADFLFSINCKKNTIIRI